VPSSAVPITASLAPASTAASSAPGSNAPAASNGRHTDDALALGRGMTE
jgi:hypothetical protein